MADEMKAFERLTNAAKNEVKEFCRNRADEAKSFLALATMSAAALAFVQKYSARAHARVK